jgi:hypothetical protein
MIDNILGVIDRDDGFVEFEKSLLRHRSRAVIGNLAVLRLRHPRLADEVGRDAHALAQALARGWQGLTEVQCRGRLRHLQHEAERIEQELLDGLSG